MAIPRVLTLTTAITLVVVTVLFAAATGITPISQNQVEIRVSGLVATGSSIHIDLSPYWVNRPIPDGTETFSFWVVIPNQGKPALEGWGSDTNGKRTDLDEIAEIGTPVILRGVRMAPVTVRPVIGQDDNWIGIEEVNFQIKAFGNGANEVNRFRRSRAFDQIISSLVVNPPEPDGVDEFDQEHLLVVVPDFIEDDIAPFV